MSRLPVWASSHVFGSNNEKVMTTLGPLCLHIGNKDEWPVGEQVTVNQDFSCDQRWQSGKRAFLIYRPDLSCSPFSPAAKAGGRDEGLYP